MPRASVLLSGNFMLNFRLLLYVNCLHKRSFSILVTTFACKLCVCVQLYLPCSILSKFCSISEILQCSPKVVEWMGAVLDTIAFHIRRLYICKYESLII